jgi:phage tail sheath protein FI
MPPALTYPGVYIQEIPSPVHTIAAVPTAVAAFVGRALRGPVNTPVRIHSFADFQRTFGSLWAMSELGYAVQQFFLNGGADAFVIRVYGSPLDLSNFNSNPPEIDLPALIGTLRIAPNSPGAWFSGVGLTVDYNTRVVSGSKVPGEFNLTFTLTEADPISGAKTITTENFANVSVNAGSPNYIVSALQNNSKFILTAGAIPAQPPNPSPPGNPYTFTGQGGPAIDGSFLTELDLTLPSLLASKQGIYALEDAEIFTLLVIPPHSPNEGVPLDLDPVIWSEALAYIRNQNRRAMLLIDPPSKWTTKDKALTDLTASLPPPSVVRDPDTVMYFPWIYFSDPLLKGQPRAFAPSAAMAGVMSTIDSRRGVWKAPAGQEATIAGVQALVYNLTDAEIGDLNPLALNCIRLLPIIGTVVWGARTLDGADAQASEWKYLPVRRTALFIEESLYRGTQWVVFEPNDEPLWSQIRLNVGSFMRSLFRQGAFQGATPQEAYFVKCDSDTTTQFDIDSGVVNILVGFAPLKPAEFVVIKISQIAGNIPT